MNSNNFVRLPLKKAYNVRELGGYPNDNGQMTKWHSYLRADDMYNLLDDDIEFLLDYGLTAILDLRSEKEVLENPNPFIIYKNISYINIPLMTEIATDATKIQTANPHEFIPQFYLDIIKNSTLAIKSIFEFFAAENKGCILFHCVAGKDRTGIISMLLLGLAKVSKYDIISNYEITYSNLRQSPVFLSNATGYPIEVMYSKAEYIEPVIDYILNTYGTFEQYLVCIGISKDTLDTISNNFISIGIKS